MGVITIFGFEKTSDKKQQPSDKKDDITQQPDAKNNTGQNAGGQNIPANLSECETLIRNIFCNSSDINVETFETQREKAMIVYIDGLTNKDLVDRDIITPLKAADFQGDINSALKTHFIVKTDIPAAVMEVTNGNVAVFYENSKKIIIIDFKQWDKRSVEPPDSEAVTRGPKEAFTENIRTNTALIRRKIRNPGLIFENLTLGRQTNTLISIFYMNGIVNQDVLNKVRQRLSKIDTDAILESGYIEEFLDTHAFSPISGIGLTQKPDIAAAKILEGRVAILCDGTPHVLIIPELFIENLHSSEDYYNRVVYSSIVRILRSCGLLIGVMLPGLSVAIITFHPEMIPSAFLSHLITSTQQTPLPSAAEAFFLILMFELLKEAGTRLPKTIGSAITIVGSLIIGDTAVNAGIVGAPMVIIVALTAVSSFIIPNLSEFIVVYRMFYLFLGASMGLIGIGSGLFIMLTNMVSTESFGVPILDSFSKYEMRDGVLRFSLKSMKYRPASIAKDNKRRMK